MSGVSSSHEGELLVVADRIFPGGALARHRLNDSHAMVFSHGKGAHLFDASGREYIDYTCGGGALILGYDNPEIVAAVQKAMGRASAFISFVNESAILYGADLVKVIPGAEQIRFCTSGQEGTFMALRLARAFTGREKILKFEGAYHGNHDYSMSSYTAANSGRLNSPAPETAGIPSAVGDCVVTAPYNDIATTRRIVQSVASDLAAIIVEPVQRLLSPRPEFLRGIRELTRDLGIMLIFDETVTGFRHALGGAQERYGITADLAVFGKSLGGGLPLAAVTGRADILSLVDPRQRGQNAKAVFFSGTGYGNPVVTASGHAMLSVLRQPNMYPPFHARCEALKSALREVIARLGLPAQVYGEGPVWHLVFSTDPIVDYRTSLKGDRDRLLAYHYGLIDNGIFVRPGGGHYFSMAHTDEDVERTIETSERVLRQVC
jgi:glutamate-1-semialdehyde 2,1-aminomutase